MDWQIQPLSRNCSVTQKPLAIGDRVVSVIYRDSEGVLTRADLHADAASDYQPEGSLLGRWEREVKDRGEETRAHRQQALASAEDFFLSLYGESLDTADSERAAFQQLLALYLERKRILRPVGEPTDGVRTYLHVKSKQTYAVPQHDIPPEQLIDLQEDLATIIGMAG